MGHASKKQRQIRDMEHHYGKKRREDVVDDEYDYVGTCDACGCDIGQGEGNVVDDCMSEWDGSLLCTPCYKEFVEKEGA